MKVRFLIMAILMIAGLLVSIFATNKLTRFCLYTPLKVLLVGLGVTVILWAVSGAVFENMDIKGYFEMKGKDLFFYPFFVCVSCCIASYTIFLCKMPGVRHNDLLSFCSFFVFPLLIAWTIVGTQGDSGVELWQTTYYSIGFVLPQIYFFADFLKKRNKGEWERD